MTGQDATQTTISMTRRACLVDGCPCKDARIVSTRRASYFASIAIARGETADRVVAVEDGWRLAVSPALESVRALAAANAFAGTSASAA